MKIAITCAKHDNAPVIPADLLSVEGMWSPAGKLIEVKVDTGLPTEHMAWASTEWGLEHDNLYCTGGTDDHEFRTTITLEPQERVSIVVD